ncbi:MAG: hypothetical protein MJ209_00030 [archaeon]|nr:hypothetical protein [archaeon]
MKDSKDIKNILLIIIVFIILIGELILFISFANYKAITDSYIYSELERRLKERDSIIDNINTLEKEANEEIERVKTLDNDSTIKLFNELIKSK